MLIKKVPKCWRNIINITGQKSIKNKIQSAKELVLRPSISKETPPLTITLTNPNNELINVSQQRQLDNRRIEWGVDTIPNSCIHKEVGRCRREITKRHVLSLIRGTWFYWWDCKWIGEIEPIGGKPPAFIGLDSSSNRHIGCAPWQAVTNS